VCPEKKCCVAFGGVSDRQRRATEVSDLVRPSSSHCSQTSNDGWSFLFSDEGVHDVGVRENKGLTQDSN